VTLAEIIDQHEAQAARARSRASLTPLGVATVAALRLRRQFAALDPADRLDIVAALSDEPPPAA